MTQQFQTLDERIQAAHMPGREQTRQSETRLCALVTACLTADLPYDHQRAYRPLRQVVVSTHTVAQDKLDELILMAQQALGQSITGTIVHLRILSAQGHATQPMESILNLPLCTPAFQQQLCVGLCCQCAGDGVRQLDGRLPCFRCLIFALNNALQTADLRNARPRLLCRAG